MKELFIEKMKNQKINYDRVLRKMIIEWEKNIHKNKTVNL